MLFTASDFLKKKYTCSKCILQSNMEVKRESVFQDIRSNVIILHLNIISNV